MTTTMFNIHSFRKKIHIDSYVLQMYALCILFFIGLIIGSFTVKNGDYYLTDKITEYYMQYLKSKSSLGGAAVFFNTFLVSSLLLLLNYFIGLCAIGIPFAALIPFGVGCVIGTVSGYIYETYMLKGLGYCAIIIFPAAVIITASIILSCRESISMSTTMMSLLSQHPRGRQKTFKEYTVKFLFYLAALAGGSIIEATMTKLFISLFSF